MEKHIEKIKNSKTVVIKIGTSTLTYENGSFNLRRIDKIARVISDIRNQGKSVVLVTSGAVCAGTTKLGMKSRPDDLKVKQAVASVGQVELMSIYGKMFSQYGYNISQILLTKDVMEDEYRRQNVINTFFELFKLSVIPIVNENDTVTVEEFLPGVFGENDTLSAVVAHIISAELLIILSDIDGLYNDNPKSNSDAKLIPVVYEINDEIEKLAGEAGSEFGTGGMKSKISAAKIATGSGCDMIIMNGENIDGIYDIFDGEIPGTIFLSK